MRFIGFNLEENKVEKLKIISFLTSKNRTQLIKEGIDYVIEKNSDKMLEFKDYVEKLEKE